MCEDQPGRGAKEKKKMDLVCYPLSEIKCNIIGRKYLHGNLGFPGEFSSKIENP